jgi:NTE family protein
MDDSREPVKEISLCLSGGGGRGPFHIGVLAYLEEQKIQVKAISGTSIGALIACSYASGVRSDELFEILSSKAFKKMIRYRFSFKSLLKLVLNDKVVSKLLRVKNLEELKIPTYVTYVSLDDGQIIRKNEGDILTYILRSVALAPAFEPIVGEDNVSYCDGGILDNLPVKPLQDYPYKIVSVNLHPDLPFVNKGFISIAKRVFFLAWRFSIRDSIKNSDLHITNTELTRFNILSFKKDQALYELGHASAKKSFEGFLQEV